MLNFSLFFKNFTAGNKPYKYLKCGYSLPAFVLHVSLLFQYLQHQSHQTTDLYSIKTV